MAGKWAAVLGILWQVSVVAASTTDLVVRVEAERVPGDSAASANAVGGFPAVLDLALPGVAVRSQGQGLPQADLSICGQPFNTSGLAVGGLPLLNPQTEHFQADLPVPAEVFRAPALLTGLDQFRQTSGHPAGSVALDFAPIERGGHAAAGVGMGEQFGDVRVSHVTDVKDADAELAEAAFADWASLDRTDGFGDNYLNRASAGGQVQERQADTQFDLLGGYGWRQFGARGFYGAPAFLPAEERVGESLLLGGVTLNEADGPPAHVTGAWQQSDDSYWLDRTAHDRYENHTISDTAGGHIDNHAAFNPNWGLDWRGDADASWIDGTHGGSIPGAGLGQHDRRHVSLAALPYFSRDDWTLTAGGSGEAFSDDSPAWLPAAGVTWQPTPHRRLSASYSEAVREPSYTELNYESPGSLGNSGLERQHTRTLEADWREQAGPADGGIGAFVQDGREMVDWVKLTPGGRWTAMNLGEVRSYGLLADGAMQVNSALSVFGSWQMIAKACDASMYASRYVLDYSRQTARVGLRARLTDRVTLNASQEAAFYAGNAARSGTAVALNARAECVWQVRRSLNLAAGVENPWDSRFETYPGQPSAGARWTMRARSDW